MSNIRLKIKWKIRIITRVLRILNRLMPVVTTDDEFYKIYFKFRKKINSIEDACVLEIGSRNVTGSVQRGNFKSAKEYVGFDYYSGDNVDVVGDAHKLSQYLPAGHFDAVFSNSVFEHLAMPWKAVLEINKVMKKGGLLFINTHPTWPGHELPWDFWRYQKASFSALFNKKTGFRIIDCQEGEPASIIVYGKHLTEAIIPKDIVYLGVAIIAEKIGPSDDTLSWDVALDDFVEGIYPAPKK